MNIYQEIMETMVWFNGIGDRITPREYDEFLSRMETHITKVRGLEERLLLSKFENIKLQLMLGCQIDQQQEQIIEIPTFRRKSPRPAPSAKNSHGKISVEDILMKLRAGKGVR